MSGGIVLKVLKDWVDRYLSDPQAILLAVLIGGSIVLLRTMSTILAPVLASIIIAYLLQWLVDLLVLRWKMPRLVAVLIAYSAFLGIFLSALFVLWPIIWQQLLHLLDELPNMINRAKEFLYLLPEQFPEYLTKETIDSMMVGLITQLKVTAKMLVTASIASLPTIIALVIYLILVPLMIFFFLKDSPAISQWFTGFLPRNRKLLHTVWEEVDLQIGNYVRGKAAEVIIMAIATYIVFYFFHLNYPLLLAVMVGLSVLIPYIGIVVVTIPVLFVAFFQWGFSSTFAYMMMVYGILQALDGAVLVPLLFSEAVNIHPLAIILAVLVFGGWWGFWGVFFAIPLAVLVKAVINAWPRKPVHA